jgi:4-hydroxy-3-polyprenylbenzoate decarboxylase
MGREFRNYPTSQNGPSGASIMLIDAVRKWAYPPVSLPKQEYMEEARRLWQELSLPELTPRTPWHGNSMGHWSEDARHLVELAESGRNDEAFQFLQSLTQRDKIGTP